MQGILVDEKSLCKDASSISGSSSAQTFHQLKSYHPFQLWLEHKALKMVTDNIIQQLYRL